MIFLVWFLGKPVFWPVRVQAQWSDFFLLQGTGLQVTPLPFVHSNCFNSSSGFKICNFPYENHETCSRRGDSRAFFHCHAWNLDFFHWLLWIFNFAWEVLVIEPGDVFWRTILYFMFSSTTCWWFWSFLSIEELVWISSLFLPPYSMLLDKKFKSEQVRLGVETAAKLGTRSNRYETLLKQRHVQVGEVVFSLANLF